MRFLVCGRRGQGYGALAWGYLFVYLLPLFTIGLWRLRSDGRGWGRRADPTPK